MAKMTEEEKRAWREKHAAEAAARKQEKDAAREARKKVNASKRKLPPLKEAVAAPVAAPVALVAAEEVLPPAEVKKNELTEAQGGFIAEVRQHDEAAQIERDKRSVRELCRRVMEDEDLQARDRLNAAALMARINGMERQEIKVEVSPEREWMARQMQRASAVPKPWEPGYKEWKARHIEEHPEAAE